MSAVSLPVIGPLFANGTFPTPAGVNVIAQSMLGASLPSTITLKSSAAGRLIELSTDGGVEYFTPAPSVTSATMIVLHVTVPVSHVRITGAAADTWSIR